MIAVIFDDLRDAINAKLDKAIAVAEELDGKPEAKYLELLRDCRGSMREALSRIQFRAMLD